MPPILTTSALSAGYGKLHILHEVSVVVESGQYLAILGPNGSGKSTLLKSIFGLTTHFSGDIQFQGASLVGKATEQIGGLGIAYVPQRENVFASMSVRENLLLALRHLSRTEADKSLAAAYELFPILAERSSQRASQLSGGERQMLAIAIGWLSRPRLMLLDEPSAGLSPLFVTEVFRTLRKLCEQGITLVVVEQNARSLLGWCDAAYILREGRVVFHGTAAETLADEETVKGYLGMGRVPSPLPRR
ncbi:MAG: ABC transporter ATP-binding protein [Chloroflexi bacterium]|nr:MAG: ABC transporter ATP-binding protein [Chloroflexota bacterium]